MPRNVLTHEKITQEQLDLYWFYRKKGIQNAFFLRYFHYLKFAPTTHEAFFMANTEYQDLFGEQRYSTVTSFRNQLKKYLNT